MKTQESASSSGSAEHVCERSGPEPVSWPVPPREAAVGKSGGDTSDSEGVGGGEDYFDTEEYQAFLADCAKHCRCTHTICGGVLAGGFCDEIIEDDADEDNYPRDEDEE